MAVNKITYIVTHADDDPELASIPFILATNALAMDIEPVIILQSKGVMLAVKNFARHVNFEGVMGLKEMMDVYIDSGHTLLVCSPCMQKRKIDQSDLIQGAMVVGAARVHEEVLSSNAVMNY